jgi:hypothetical protein
MNTLWDYEEYRTWSEAEYADESNRDNWLPNHQYLRTEYADDQWDNFKIHGRNMTNKEVYFYSPDDQEQRNRINIGEVKIHDKYKYSYLKNQRWIHLCECSGTSDEADKENGFTNCKCAQSQYLDENDTCKYIESGCYKNGNYFNGVKIVEGEFWNIKDPYCNFFHSTDDQRNQWTEREQVRCCVGCSHKVYKGGVPDHPDHGKHTVSPDYAFNWFDPSDSFSQLTYDESSDPILTSSPGTLSPDYDWRKYDYSIGFNSRPKWYKPEFSDPTPVSMSGLSANPITVQVVLFQSISICTLSRIQKIIMF